MNKDRCFLENLRANGYALITGAMSLNDVDQARSLIKNNLNHFYKTRHHIYSGHLPDFCSNLSLAALNDLLLKNLKLNNYLNIDKNEYEDIGLNDITLNRSQDWHTDLLRGKYKNFLNDDLCWYKNDGVVYKILWYLQDGESLKVLSGQHTKPRPLESDIYAQPLEKDLITQVKVKSTDLVVMDLRLPHRGSSDSELEHIQSFDASKILVTTVVGKMGHELSNAMKIGNKERTNDWLFQNKYNVNRNLMKIK